MIELGSYWAHYSMWFQKQFPEADCFMVEADSNNLEAGRSNFVANNFLNGNFILSQVSDDGFKLDTFYQEKNLMRSQFYILTSKAGNFRCWMAPRVFSARRRQNIYFCLLTAKKFMKKLDRF